MKNPKIEALKEVGRWLVFFLASSLLIGIEAQLNLLPSELWGITLRPVFVFILTSAGRYLDKFKHEEAKLLPRKTAEIGKPHGILPF